MPDTIERRYSPLVPPDMQDELFWKDGLDPKMTAFGFPTALAVGRAPMPQRQPGILGPYY